MKKSIQEDPRTQDELQHLNGEIFALFLLASKAKCSACRLQKFMQNSGDYVEI
jgi:hypothetical protein